MAKKTKEMDDCEAQIKQERADNPQAIYWDEAEKTYKKERRREDEGGPLREEAPMQSAACKRPERSPKRLQHPEHIPNRLQHPGHLSEFQRTA